jgi:hypothetical protein
VGVRAAAVACESLPGTSQRRQAFAARCHPPCKGEGRARAPGEVTNIIVLPCEPQGRE